MIRIIVERRHNHGPNDVVYKEGNLIRNINELIMYFSKQDKPIIFIRHYNAG